MPRKDLCRGADAGVDDGRSPPALTPRRREEHCKNLVAGRAGVAIERRPRRGANDPIGDAHVACAIRIEGDRRLAAEMETVLPRLADGKAAGVVVELLERASHVVSFLSLTPVADACHLRAWLTRRATACCRVPGDG